MNFEYLPVRCFFFGALVVSCSCAHLFGGGRTDDPEELLGEVDRLLGKRHERANLDRAMDLLGELSLDMGDDPRLLSRTARAQHALAYGFQPEEPPPLRIYEAGREVAWRCLYQDPAFEGVLSSFGGRIQPVAVARIQEDRAGCLFWLVANWTRWLALRGPAGFGIDLEPLGVLAERAVTLETGENHPQALGYSGLAMALEPMATVESLNEAEDLFIEAIRLDPDNLGLRVDLAEYVYARREDALRFGEQLEEVLASPVPSTSRWALENRRAQTRARSLLDLDVDTPDQPS